LEVWFPGVHCDVGGGYPEAESGLAKLSLEWMIQEAATAGMAFDQDRVDLMLGRNGQGFVAPDPRAVMHNSLTLPWWPAEFLPKRHWNSDLKRWQWRVNLFRRRRFSPAPCVDDSAWQRGDAYLARIPGDAATKTNCSGSLTAQQTNK
jgi:hypothetical protein